MTTDRKSILIANARSGSNSDAALQALCQCLGEHGIGHDRLLDISSEGPPAAAELEAEKVGRVIVFAGDGTVNAVVNGLAGWGGEILVLPGGTMNLLSVRLHGDAVREDEIVARVARGAYRLVRPEVASCSAGKALAGLLAGPGTAWADVREAMRDVDVLRFATGAGEAVSRTASGARVRFGEPGLGRDDGYPLVEITPGTRGLQIDAYSADKAADYLQHSWALLRRSFREGPHERLGLLDRFELVNCESEPIEVLIDGEPATLGPRAEFEVARCAVDLLATGHGF
ncbi:hypothetical protein K3172_02155 [Qipengyuania sp. 6B39]|uniref:diacylglycerol/lipid kinase family protein n=1 Tax=Qipengyuania proteolytica TaxID=2867239 RepID=UPI001C89D90E|nr:diacylglycerol kinase family protein [Qipengyuania proteolytica]MBX7494655.1 hypothetical protein [Qipengyuania proteolytica]